MLREKFAGINFPVCQRAERQARLRDVQEVYVPMRAEHIFPIGSQSKYDPHKLAAEDVCSSLCV